MIKGFKSRPLTKSRFKIGLECPRKLYYGGLDKLYANKKLDDPFLEALAEGGFQVGELAKEYFPGGVNVDTLDYDEALIQTNELLKQDNAVIFEAAVQYEDLFIRADVLEKRGNSFYLHEVKAKSIGAEGKNSFLTKSGKPSSNWKPYLYDVAFQKFVVQKAFPNSRVFSHLMLVDKTVRTQSHRLNQKFQIQTKGDGIKEAVLIEPLTNEELKTKILTSINIDDICNEIFHSENHRHSEVESFSDLVNRLTRCSLGSEEALPQLTKSCGECEFQGVAEINYKKDGLIECVSKISGLSGDVVATSPLIFELWNHRGKQSFIDNGLIRLADLTEEDIKPEELVIGDGLSQRQRQWLQIEKTINRDSSTWVDTLGLKNLMESWNFPLNFIDFETTRVALPFHENQVPYEAIAFQFSHHVLHEDGRIEHANQFLNTTRGEFPNFYFVRALKAALEGNSGSVFCYSQHENGILNAIKSQLRDEKVHDADELIDFIETIAKPTHDALEKWASPRLMIDLLEVIKKYLYLPKTNGSNSIKHVLPAVLADSTQLKKFYSRSVYQNKHLATSLNFPSSWVWLKCNEQGDVVDPYKLLPPVFESYGFELNDQLSGLEALNNGGAALTAYAKLQFTDISQDERKLVEAALLKYCELDTLAMVMIYQYLSERIN